jgi:fatty acid desaturase
MPLRLRLNENRTVKYHQPPMATAEALIERPVVQRKIKGDGELKRVLQDLCRTDNWTNWSFIARAYLVIAVSIAGVVWLYNYLVVGNGVLWAILGTAPAAVVAIMAIGASQHQLAGATHEATHHTLFRNKLMNELVSDWLCMFPLISTTYSFRLYHLIHHQFINDPKHDPDFVVLAESGHWLGFPAAAKQFYGLMARQILIFPLLRYILIRFKSNSVGVEGANAYKREGKNSKLPESIGAIWLLGLLAMQVALAFVARPWLILVAGPSYWLALASMLAILPEWHFRTARLKPVVPRRYLAMSRTFFFMALFSALTYAQLITAQPVWWFFIVLWVIPLVTSFPFFMILRQVVQHGNGDRGWLTNTRVFLVNPFVKYAVFPFGMDYHLPHHMYATVPHYNLPRLHAFLINFPEYVQDSIIVENYVIPKSHQHPRNPTVVEVLGPDYARSTGDVYIDNTVLDGWDVDEKEEILRHAGVEAAKAAE